jgi:hypothetical protein
VVVSWGSSITSISSDSWGSSVSVSWGSGVSGNWSVSISDSWGSSVLDSWGSGISVSWGRSVVGNWGSSVVGNWRSDGISGNWSSGDNSLGHLWGGSLNDGVESVDIVSGVGDSSDGTVRLDKGVLSFDDISVSGLGGGLLVSGESVRNGVSVVVLWMRVVWLWSGGCNYDVEIETLIDIETLVLIFLRLCLKS